MTIGIYSLYWEEPDLIYIGLSENIERRFKEHLQKLCGNKHYNYKVQNAYNKYSEPTYTILEECSTALLSSLEIAWCKEFKGIGLLNIAEPGVIQSSPFSRHKKYSKIQILKVFSMLYRDSYTSAQIHDRTKVSLSTINGIAFGTKHTWLKEEYPEKYTLLLNRVPLKHRTKTNKRTIVSKGFILTPAYESIEIFNLKDFCMSQDILNQDLENSAKGISKLLANPCKLKSYKGFTKIVS